MENTNSVIVRPEDREKAYQGVLSFVVDIVKLKAKEETPKFNFEVKIIEELESGRGGSEGLIPVNYIHTLYFDGRMNAAVFETRGKDYVRFDYYINRNVL